jgi:protease I
MQSAHAAKTPRVLVATGVNSTCGSCGPMAQWHLSDACNDALRQYEGFPMHTASVLAAIEKTVRLYFDGMHHGDTTKLRQALHADAYLFGFYHGDFSRVSLEEWMTEVQGMEKPAQTGEVFDMRIVAVDTTGPTAQAKVAELYAGVRYTVYLSLMQIGEDWKIVNKLYLSD